MTLAWLVLNGTKVPGAWHCFRLCPYATELDATWEQSKMNLDEEMSCRLTCAAVVVQTFHSMSLTQNFSVQDGCRRRGCGNAGLPSDSLLPNSERLFPLKSYLIKTFRNMIEN